MQSIGFYWLVVVSGWNYIKILLKKQKHDGMKVDEEPLTRVQCNYINTLIDQWSMLSHEAQNKSNTSNYPHPVSSVSLWGVELINEVLSNNSKWRNWQSAGGLTAPEEHSEMLNNANESNEWERRESPGVAYSYS